MEVVEGINSPLLTKLLTDNLPEGVDESVTGEEGGDNDEDA